MAGKTCAAAIHLGRMLPSASCNPPGQLAWKPACQALRLHALSLFGLAPDGVYHAIAITGNAVGSYPTLSPLPARGRTGGLLSAALSLRSPSPDVIRHRVSVEPGLSSPAAFRHWSGAAARPTDSLLYKIKRQILSIQTALIKPRVLINQILAFFLQFGNFVLNRLNPLLNMVKMLFQHLARFRTGGYNRQRIL